MVATIAPHAFGGGGLLRQGGVRIGWDGVGWGWRELAPAWRPALFWCRRSCSFAGVVAALLGN